MSLMLMSLSPFTSANPVESVDLPRMMLTRVVTSLMLTSSPFTSPFFGVFLTRMTRRSSFENSVLLLLSAIMQVKTLRSLCER